MKRKYVYLIAILISLTLTISEFLINKKFEEQVIQNTADNLVNDTGNTYNAEINGLPFTLTNIQSDNVYNIYTYKLKIDDIIGAFKYTKNNVEDYLVFNAGGEVIITLQNNESITIYDVPADSHYVLTQNINNKYNTTVDGIVTNVVEGVVNEKNNIVFDNLLTDNAIPEENNNNLSGDDTNSENNENNNEEKQDDETNSKEEEIPPVKNPVTIDKIIIYFGILFVTVMLVIGYKVLKIKRFE